MGMYSLVVMVAQLASPMAWLEKERVTGQPTQAGMELRGIVEECSDQHGGDVDDGWRFTLLTWTPEGNLQYWDLRGNLGMYPARPHDLKGKWITVTGMPSPTNGVWGLETQRIFWVWKHHQYEDR